MRTLGIIALGFILTLLAIAIVGNDAGSLVEVGLLQ